MENEHVWIKQPWRETGLKLTVQVDNDQSIWNIGILNQIWICRKTHTHMQHRTQILGTEMSSKQLDKFSVPVMEIPAIEKHSAPKNI